MAQRYVTDEGVLVIPGAYPSIKVQKNNSGLATSGVIFLIGEAEAGPAWNRERDLSTNFFAPSELSEVIAKYKGGNIVDAFRAVASPANDANLPGSPSFVYVIKTNDSTKASATMKRSGMSDYGVLADGSFGQLGNLTYFSVWAVTPESPASTGTTAYIPGPDVASDGSILAMRVNGGAKRTVSITALMTPAALVAAVNAVPDVLATGGADRGVLNGLASSATLSVVASGADIAVALGGGSWTKTPSVGDTFVIPADATYGAVDTSAIAGAGDANVGAYVVTSATSNLITARKLRDGDATGVTAPVSVGATAIGAEAKDFFCFAPICITNMTGTDRSILTDLVGVDIEGTASAKALKITLKTGFQWASTPQSGDRVKIAATAPAAIRGTNDANVGWYTVMSATAGTSAGASTITMERISDGSPVSFVATAIASMSDLRALRPDIDGVAKTLELYDGEGNISINTLFFSTTGQPVGWVSTAGAPYVITSSAEKAVAISVNRQFDGIDANIIAGGAVALKVGYAGTTATMTITGTHLTTNVSDGIGQNLNLKLSNFRRLSDLAAYVNSQSGYTASVGTSLMGQLSTSVLDQGTFGIASELGAKSGHVKKDAHDLFKRLTDGISAVQLGVVTPRAAASGLPEAQPVTYLDGGAKGGTSSEGAVAAITALESLRGNFVVPLFSRDAVDDIEDGLTDEESSYRIDAVHAAVSSHVLEMSKLKRRRHRQALLSFAGSFADAKAAAQNVANYRCSMTFQYVRALGGDGTIRQYQPWMGAVLAAGMQAAGFYRSIVFKGVNCSGVLVPDGSFSDQSDANLESAIENGLLAMQRPDSGPIRWNTDQTTYATDESFVFNSLQAIYASDVIALTVAQRMERAFVGQSVADVSASIALAFLKGVMADLKRLKLIAASDDAPLGYRNARIVISGNAMRVEMEIKLAGAILFIPISFLVTQVQQTAAQ